MADPHKNTGTEFSKDELFDYVDGELEDERKKQLDAHLAVDRELRAKINVIRHLVDTYESDKHADEGLVDSVAPEDADKEGT